MRLKLKEFCRKQRLTLSELAHLTGIARMSLWRYATGKQDITLSQLEKIIRATSSRLRDILDDNDEYANKHKICKMILHKGRKTC